MKALVEVDDLRKDYVLGGETIHALRGVSMRVERGELLSIMGPSGSGKSTLLNIMAALDKPDAGSVVIAGKVLHRASQAELATMRRDVIGVVFQFYNLIPSFTAIENVMLPMRPAPGRGTSTSRREKAARLLDLVRLPGKEDRRPDQLSGGERQRVAIARALANDPALVLADEPTGNLDQDTGREIMHLFGQLNAEGNRTFVIVTHDPRVASRAHRIVALRDGRVDHDTG